jgi:hypothetical protein
MEAAAMAQVPLAGTDWYPGKPSVQGTDNDKGDTRHDHGSGRNSPPSAA